MFHPTWIIFDKEIMIPCGIDGRGVTSMKELLNERGDNTCCPSVEEVGEVALSCFENVFNVELDRHEQLMRFKEAGGPR